MNKPDGFILILLFLEVMIFTWSIQSCQENEREALLDFKKSVRDASNRLSSWVGEDCCKWNGVGCDNQSGHVVTLDLRNPLPYDQERGDYKYGYRDITYEKACLTAIEVNPSLIQLQHLNYLDLSWNNFSGTEIPNLFGSFRKLTYLNLSCACFGGTVPHQLGNLLSLQTLDLKANFEYHHDDASYASYYDVPKPRVDTFHWVSHLFSLEHLDMTGVDLSSVAIDSSGAIAPFPSNLLELRLSDCGLSANTLFNYLRNLSSLLILDLSKNLFSSTLSVQNGMKNLLNLESLDLSENNFHSLPSWSYQLKKLRYLDFSGNSVPPVHLSPTWLRSFPNLKELHLKGIGLTGPIPASLGNLSSLEVLSLGKNQFNGTIPTSLSALSALRELLFDSNELSGPIPARLGALPRLNVMDFSLNNLSGLIPTSLGNLTSLSKLDLSNNQLRGSIPESLGHLPMLSELRLASNLLTGHFPVSLGSLPQMTILDLKFNQMSGPILFLLERWPSLTTLYISNNKFNGSVPETLGHLSQLVNLDLSYNLFTGSLSEIHFAKLSKLKTLSLTSNPLSVKVPFGWVPPFQLTVIHLALCYLGPHFPNWIRTQTRAEVLVMFGSGISDSIPNWFHKIPPTLKWIDFSRNQIWGAVPNFVISPSSYLYLFLRSNKLTGPFPPLSNVIFLDLADNSIVGRIPQNIGDMLTGLTFLSLSNNHFYGNVPKSLCKMHQLTFLDLANNSLSGNLPQCWGNFQQLSVVDLTSNRFTGTIPSSICRPPSLRSLRLSNNSFYGQLPAGLQHCSRLSLLNIGENKLSGRLPTWIGQSLPSLEVLRLRSNKFNGSISQNLCHLKKLRILDIALNNISGKIPRCFGQFNGMIFNQTGYFKNINTDPVYVEQLSQVMKGRELEYMQTLPFLINMDLSNNNLFGEVPEALTNLSGLIGLNLSDNHLTGNIPKSIGQMRSLESLDLSKNDLSGMIPQSISSLSSLSLLNLSHNHLSGSIPTGQQLQTLNDPSIYEGNQELCGSPLVKKCQGDEPRHHPSTNQGKDKGDDLRRTWFWIGFASGSAVGFWGFMSVLYFKKTWRYACFRFVEDMNDKLYVVVAISTIRLKRALKLNED
ncbi:lysine--tRNA ligase [Ranunculus cassubicifolius]